MKSIRSTVSGYCLIAAMMALAATASVHAQRADTATPPQGAAQPPARGPGRGAAPLGEGPWTIDTETARIGVSVVAKGLDHPWGMAFLPNGDVLVTERPGRLRVLRNGKLDPTPIAGLPAIETGLIGGLLDIALHPNFPENRLVYFSYSKPDAADSSLHTTAVARARWDGGSSLANVEDVFVADAWHSAAIASAANRCCGQGPAGGSYGSRIVFDADGLLYVTVGDRNFGERAQDPASHLGKIVRVRDDGSVPSNNPFVGREGYKPEILTTGHRNPLGLTIHPTTGELWSTEFGPRGGDELNRIEAGKNYGWMLVTEGAHYNDEPVALGKNSVPGMQDPVLFWVPSINPGNIVFYTGDAIPAWRGDLLMATMTRSLLRVRFDADGRPVSQERMLTELGQRLRDVRQGPDGLVYVLTDESDGALLRIEAAR